MHIKTARYFVATVDSGKYCDFSFCHFLYFFDDQTGETHSVLKRTTELIQSLICSCGKESAYQIAMCHMDLNCIYACFHGSLCCKTIAFYQFVNFFSCNFLWCISSAVCRNACSSLDRCTCIFRISFRTCILKLYRNFCSLCMTGINYLAEAFDCGIIIKTWFARAAFCAFMYYGCFNCDQSKTTFCSLSIVSYGLFAHASVCVCKVISHWRNYETVLYCHWSDVDRLEHCIKFHVAFSFSFGFLFIYCYVLYCSVFLFWIRQAWRFLPDPFICKILTEELPAMPLQALSLCSHKYGLQHIQVPLQGLHR